MYGILIFGIFHISRSLPTHNRKEAEFCISIYGWALMPWRRIPIAMLTPFKAHVIVDWLTRRPLLFDITVNTNAVFLSFKLSRALTLPVGFH